MSRRLFRIAPRTEEAESWSLRPEPTAGIVRAYVQHGMQTWPQPVKLTLLGPMFRYDRPQAGRYRQFRQFDVEAIGDPGPAVDAELVELGLRFYRDVGLEGVEVLLNSIGDAACRPAYVAELTDYYRAHADRLPSLERERLEQDPLRLLDSREPQMQELNALAPKITEPVVRAMCSAFHRRQAHLDALGVSYRLEPTLVRGLDYYTRTAFEFYRRGAEGSSRPSVEAAVRRARRALGGKPTPGSASGSGWIGSCSRCGVERRRCHEPRWPSSWAPTRTRPWTGSVSRPSFARRASLLRAELGRRKLGKQLEAAAKEHAHFAVIIGDELGDGQVQVKASTAPAPSRSQDLAQLARAHGAHRHGPGDAGRGSPSGGAGAPRGSRRRCPQRHDPRHEVHASFHGGQRGAGCRQLLDPVDVLGPDAPGRGPGAALGRVLVVGRPIRASWRSMRGSAGWRTASRAT